MVLALCTATARAEVLRFALWNVEMVRNGPGLLARDLAGGRDPQLRAAERVLAALDADVLLLTGFDYDRGLVAAKLLAGRLAERIAPYPHLLALRPNRGWPSGIDLDGDGRRGGPGDAQGWGQFSGQEGMLLLSRWPLGEVVDHSAFLWADLPGALLPPGTSEAQRAVQRLSSTAHWQVPVRLPGAERVTLLLWHATPPVFDGPEDRNGRRNHDEAAFWLRLLEGALPAPSPEGALILMGTSNLDPEDGEGRRAAIRALLSHPRLRDVAPRSGRRQADPGHRGDPALDTAVFATTGGLRVDLVVPGAELDVVASGILWAEEGEPLAGDLQAASRHWPVWVDVRF